MESSTRAMLSLKCTRCLFLKVQSELLLFTPEPLSLSPWVLRSTWPTVAVRILSLCPHSVTVHMHCHCVHMLSLVSTHCHCPHTVTVPMHCHRVHALALCPHTVAVSTHCHCVHALSLCPHTVTVSTHCHGVPALSLCPLTVRHCVCALSQCPCTLTVSTHCHLCPRTVIVSAHCHRVHALSLCPHTQGFHQPFATLFLANRKPLWPKWLVTSLRKNKCLEGNFYAQTLNCLSKLLSATVSAIIWYAMSSNFAKWRDWSILILLCRSHRPIQCSNEGLKSAYPVDNHHGICGCAPEFSVVSSKFFIIYSYQFMNVQKCTYTCTHT